MNYLSLWIGNFGVVPWLSFAFFLFLPIFLSLRALLVLVCFVLEAIIYPFAKLLHSETRFLTPWAHNVKAFLCILALSGTTLSAKEPKSDEFFLAKGEQIELKLTGLSSFSVGNKEVVNSKYYASQEKLLVKGKGLGFSDLVIWNKSGVKRTLHFYVVSKKEQLKNFQLANDFKSLGLEVKALAFELLVKGELTSSNKLSLFNLYIKKNKDRVINMVEVSKELQHDIIANIYLQLADQTKGLVCTSFKTGFECLFDEMDIHSPLVKKIISKYNVSFSPSSKSLALDNFKIELKIIKTDETELSSMGLGLDKLSTQATDIFNNKGPQNLIGNNHILLTEQQLNSKVISHPSILTTIGQTSQIQLGADIPITNKMDSGSTTSWKFAGLQLKARLDLSQIKLKLALESELTYPVDKLIRGSKSKSEFFPKLDKYIEAFQVRYDIKSENAQSIPGLAQIPILKSLFSSNSTQATTQWLVGYVKITRIK